MKPRRGRRDAFGCMIDKILHHSAVLLFFGPGEELLRVFSSRPLEEDHRTSIIPDRPYRCLLRQPALDARILAKQEDVLFRDMRAVLPSLPPELRPVFDRISNPALPSTG